jgi:hypothetical protein
MRNKNRSHIQFLRQLKAAPKACHQSLSYARQIHLTNRVESVKIFSFNISLGLPSCIQTFLTPPNCATFPVHLILLDLTALTLIEEENKLLICQI